ncbi:MAG: hypothetical protein A2134_00200 [Candidatus Woykebacteria bacterium RBG_16_39_9b]|uniref:Uncharacterized protein n=1 Tax=Candidatus Woykebacteria bacterium RBG_16_39_9b TaxID=1802595 RepID=A0A1G1WDX2_9BACT|nr:MAG: hypothetical protein A2134_00200 [Candidatus Woykebacteria bacterium RBG_16_39_9b]
MVREVIRHICEGCRSAYLDADTAQICEAAGAPPELKFGLGQTVWVEGLGPARVVVIKILGLDALIESRGAHEVIYALSWPTVRRFCDSPTRAFPSPHNSNVLV